MSDFNYKNTISDIQSRLVSQSIRTSANLDFLKSEESIRATIKSYQDKFNVTEGMLLEVSNFIVKSADIIKIEAFNDLFESIFIDLSSLYYDLDLVDKILKLNLGRNKNYFLIIKKRIKDLWNKLRLTRLQIYDDNPSSESFYESFFTKINAGLIENCVVDKKGGVLHLAKEYTRTQNKSPIIKNVTSVTYPEHNDFGGVRFTSNVLNSFSDNYTSGSRDMLENGLWKEQVICNEIPELVITSGILGDSSISVNKTYKGIVSMVDIEYVYPVEINRFDFDVFGDNNTKIDAVLYKNTSDAEWSVATMVPRNRIVLEDLYGELVEPVKGDAFDIITFYNITKIKAKYLRIIFNQENYVFLDSKDIKEKTVDEKIQEDLSERRYELVRFGSDLDDLISKPTNDENQSLYYKIINIIESTKNIEKMLDEIDNLIDPKVDVLSYDFERTVKFEIGAWSIEPKIEKYTKVIGKFDSLPYTIKDGSISDVSLITSQTLPKSSTVDWYVGIGGKNIPVMVNNDSIRREVLYPVDMNEYSVFSSWTDGSFFLLDFPIDPLLSDYIYLSINGGQFYKVSDFSSIVYLNSRLIYINDIQNPFECNYVVQYPAAVKSAVNLYGLTAKPGIVADKNVTLDVVSSRYEVLKTYITKIPESYGSNDIKNMSDLYDVVSITSTKEEAALWFGQNYSMCMFVGMSVGSYFNVVSTEYDLILSRAYSKASCKKSDMTNYISGTKADLSNLELIGTVPNIVPFTNIRSI